MQQLLYVDGTLGLILAVVVHPAGVQNYDGALLAQVVSEDGNTLARPRPVAHFLSRALWFLSRTDPLRSM